MLYHQLNSRNCIRTADVNPTIEAKNSPIYDCIESQNKLKNHIASNQDLAKSYSSIQSQEEENYRDKSSFLRMFNLISISEAKENQPTKRHRTTRGRNSGGFRNHFWWDMVNIK